MFNYWTNDIYDKIDEGQSTLLIALDMSAAIDTVENSRAVY